MFSSGVYFTGYLGGLPSYYGVDRLPLLATVDPALAGGVCLWTVRQKQQVSGFFSICMGFQVFVTVVAFSNDYVKRPAAQVDVKSIPAIFYSVDCKTLGHLPWFSVWIYSANG